MAMAPTHHAGVPEWVTDGQEAAVAMTVQRKHSGRSGSQRNRTGPHGWERDRTAFWGHSGHQHFGHSDRGEPHVNEGQVG